MTSDKKARPDDPFTTAGTARTAAGLRRAEGRRAEEAVAAEPQTAGGLRDAEREGSRPHRPRSRAPRVRRHRPLRLGRAGPPAHRAHAQQEARLPPAREAVPSGRPPGRGRMPTSPAVPAHRGDRGTGLGSHRVRTKPRRTRLCRGCRRRRHTTWGIGSSSTRCSSTTCSWAWCSRSEHPRRHRSASFPR